MLPMVEHQRRRLDTDKLRLVMQRELLVSLPPAIVILNQLVFGAVFGLLGLALATPLAAAATVPLRHVFGVKEDETENGETPST